MSPTLAPPAPRPLASEPTSPLAALENPTEFRGRHIGPSPADQAAMLTAIGAASLDSLLDEIASVILAHPEIKKIRVEGHTDSDGPDSSNLKLSQARTQAVVDYLVSKGVERSRLDPVGFGESRPIAENTTPEGKAKNRRVEFIIVSRE